PPRPGSRRWGDGVLPRCDGGRPRLDGGGRLLGRVHPGCRRVAPVPGGPDRVVLHARLQPQREENQGPTECVGDKCMCVDGYCDAGTKTHRCRARVGVCTVLPCDWHVHGNASGESV
ncbi:unnamed protein product, partial [Prorocentrum cordatum]